MLTSGVRAAWRLGSRTAPRWRRGPQARGNATDAVDPAAGKDDALKNLSALADSDPRALARVGRSLTRRTLAKLESAVQTEAGVIERLEPLRPSREQLLLVALAPMPLFTVFGIIDNAVMIVAGEYFDATLGVAFGISTMAAAGLGNLVSDVLGLGVGGMVEERFEKLGLIRNPNLTRAQESMPVVRRARLLGNAIGVSVGCLIGMFPLLFMDFDVIARRKRQSKLDELFEAVMKYVNEALQAESATLYIVDADRKELWTQTSVSTDTASGIRRDTRRIRVPIEKSLVGYCATTGDVVNQAIQPAGNVLCTPIFGRTGDIIGVVQVQNKNEGKRFKVKDEVALAAMSAHISCALERVISDSDAPDEKSEQEDLLRALKASFEHHNHHLRFATERADGGRVELT
ncbi:cAMP and cAMP-inhibited cGMP 3',5'-cyclic phosphodiesterase 10A [Hondaea fermentalgiana]|uniref:cAMP and cAMP-inhibited cGMP 3',5'-cyclic phosphodiesterase 10A n=1 Tax=Hondaea fermentalgiana TaxID=2315210 RepID=A0A2R5GS23_9STRA|nr:cAMP and cAMP-inhibited cGMP 3',5'-cyclic phosphodiesterase 10A [Hondaea fermentalgiana]|eukprot:GBG31141.1 cAMP and cAMP-inhibited cGMP 3',5'-cyclic phosphodiesterase 10A [Hondaea fermentalgiana]